MNKNISTSTINLDGKTIILETGKFGTQAAGTVTARCGDTIVLASAVTGEPREGIDFFPLTIEYREKHYAGGVISSSRFVKRESKPSDNEILTARLIDRSVRPLFPKDFYDEVQIIVHPLSIDHVNEPEVLGIIASAAALAVSQIPFTGDVAAVRVGIDKDGNMIANPTSQQKESSSLDLVISGSTKGIAMVEAGASQVSEETVLKALKFGQEQIEIVIAGINDLVKQAGKEKKILEATVHNPALIALVDKKLNVNEVIEQSKTVGGEGIKLSPIIDSLAGDDEEIDRIVLGRLIDERLKDRIRELIIKDKIRFDGRKTDEIRQITSEVGLLPRTHGSAFFQRGATHALSVATLASPAAAQLIDGMKGEETKRYMHHYNMSPIATGEPGRFGTPSRRETGHGALAERALMAVLPAEEDFPYTVRVVSEIMSSNGSTSQASVCGSTLALMDAGVPIIAPVAGIAMGLIIDGDNFVTLSDIAGLEDHFGDMDFKVAGTKQGITAIQMDVKVAGVTADMLETALEQARLGRLHILERMLTAISEPRAQLSKYAPRIESVTIPGDKIGLLIGPGGKTIRELQVLHSVEINVEEADGKGFVSIAGIDPEKVAAAKKFVADLTAEVEVGTTYTGTVKRLMDFGAFVEVMPGQEGLVHVSNMGEGFVKHPSEVVKEGDTVQVKVYEIDPQGRINLTMKLNEDPTSRGPRGGGDRDPRPGNDRGGFRPRPSGDRGPRRDAPRGGNRDQSRFQKFQDFR